MFVDNHAFGLLNRVGRRFPRAIPAINRAAARAASTRERVDWSFRIFASPRLVRFTEMEYAVPREHAAEAVLGAREILERHPVSFPVEFRLVAADDALLSPAHGRDSAYIAVHVFEGMAWQPPFREVEALMGSLGGRPHWGKWSFLRAAELAPRYPDWETFQAVRAELDPTASSRTTGRGSCSAADRTYAGPLRPVRISCSCRPSPAPPGWSTSVTGASW